MSRSEITLDIDLEAGFRTVAGHQLAGPWQVPAELVRMLIAFGARTVEAKIRARRWHVVGPGAVLPPGVIEGLATILNNGADTIGLHALATLEDLDATALGWAVGTAPRRLQTEQQGPEGGIALVREGEAPAQIKRSQVSSQTGIRIVLDNPEINSRQAAAWLGTACRFAEVEVALNGDDLRRDLDSGCFRARLVRPVPMTVALGVALEAPRLWLLRHGILEGRVAVPGWPAFEAAVELAGEVQGWTSPAELRRIVSSHLPDIMTAVVGLMLRVVPRFPEIAGGCRSALVASLLTAVEKRVRPEEVRRAPIFELEEGGRRRWVSLGDLDRRRASLPAVVHPPDLAEAHEGPVLYLEPVERTRIGALLGVGFPSAMLPRRTAVARLRRGPVEFIRHVCASLGRRSVAEEHLDVGERELAGALADCFSTSSGSVSVAFVSGAGRVRRSWRWLYLPRADSLVRACVAAFAADSRWLYAVARALGCPRWRIDDAVRRPWL